MRITFAFIFKTMAKLIEEVGRKDLYKDPVLLDIWLNVLKGLM